MLLKPAVQLIGLSLLALSLPAAAENDKKIADKKIVSDTLITATRSSTSISIPRSSNLDKTSRDKKLKNSDTVIRPALVKEGDRIESTAASVKQLKVNQISASANNAKLLSVTSDNHDFTLYDASTELISDFNYDGFYHRFSVTFDADTIYDVAYVYAKIYLSYEGGPWNHYATSDDYHIYLDNEDDTMTIETELDDGFSPGYYDVRIELYDADHNEWLLSYGPYDDASLSALPLEDSYYDDPDYINDGHLTTEVIVSAHGHHGAMSWLLLLIPALITTVRRTRVRTKQKRIA
jgi:hypothetical protein